MEFEEVEQADYEAMLDDQARAEYEADMDARTMADMEAEQHEEEMKVMAGQEVDDMAEEQYEEEMKQKEPSFEKMIDKITTDLYSAYGSGTGVLFGIPSNLRSAVRAIVKVILKSEKQKVREAIINIKTVSISGQFESIMFAIDREWKRLGL